MSYPMLLLEMTIFWHCIWTKRVCGFKTICFRSFIIFLPTFNAPCIYLKIQCDGYRTIFFLPFSHLNAAVCLSPIPSSFSGKATPNATKCAIVFRGLPGLLWSCPCPLRPENARLLEIGGNTWPSVCGSQLKTQARLRRMVLRCAWHIRLHYIALH
jgi:hypothetical protein